MAAIQLIAKDTGQVTDVSGNNLMTLARPCVVKITAAPEDIESVTRSGDKLVVRLKSGDVITVEKFFVLMDGVRSELVIENPSGHDLWLAEYSEPWSGVELVELEALGVTLPELAGEGLSGMEMLGIGLGVVGLGGLLVHGGGGGGGGGSAPAGAAPKAPSVLVNNLNGLAGVAEPGSLITFVAPAAGSSTSSLSNMPLTTTADDLGHWSFVPNPLQHGESGHVFASNAFGSSAQVSTGLADIIRPEPPVVTDNNGNGLAGTGEAGGTVTVQRPDGSTVTTVVDEEGHWSFPQNPLGDGEKGQVTITDSSGNVSDSTETGVADTVPPLPPLITENNGNGLAGTGEAGGTVTVERPDGSTVTTVVDEEGHWSFPENPLGDGDKGQVTITDPSGNTSPPTDTGVADLVRPEAPLGDLTLQLFDDVEPVTGPIVRDGSTNDDRPTFSGQVADPSDVKCVRIYDNGQLIGSVSVDEAGAWSFTPDQVHALKDGLHNFQAASVDAAGNESIRTEDWHFTLITAALKPPVDPDDPQSLQLIDDVGAITGMIPQGGYTDDARPEFKGELGVNSGAVAVNVYDQGSLIGSAAVDAAGNWSFTPDADLTEGAHNFQAAAVDAAGNEGALTEGWAFTLDLGAPGALPSHTEYYDLIDDVGPVTGSIERDSVTDDTRPTFVGRGAAADVKLVLIYDNGRLIGSTAVDADGNWSFTPAKPLKAGAHNFQAAAANLAGNTTGELTPDWVFTVEVPLPTAASILHVIDDQAPFVSDHLQPGSVTDDRTPTVVGSAPPGSTVTLFVNGVAVGSVLVDESCEWTITVKDLGEDGEKVLTAQSVDAYGKESPLSGGFKLVLDTTPPATPEQPAASDNVGFESGPILPGSVTDDANPTFTGIAEPGATVILKDNGKLIGSATVDRNGHWSFTPIKPLSDGHHSIAAVVRDKAGNSSEPSVSLDFSIDTSAVVVSIIKAIDDFGPVQGEIADNSITDDRTPTLVGVGKPGALVKVYEGKTLLGSTTVNESGQWNLTLPEQAEGERHYLAAAEAIDGTKGQAGFNLVIDFSAPARPGEVTITDNVGEPGNGSSQVPPGGSTNDTTPVISGSGAEPGDVITILDHGKEVLGSVVVDQEGNWQFKPEEPLPEGEHEISVTATDSAGNVSEPSPGVTVIVDATPPAAMESITLLDDVDPVVGEIPREGHTNDARPEFAGTLRPGEAVRVNVYDNTQLIGTATVTADGHWSFTPDTDLSEGWHAFEAEAVDAAGNLGAKTPLWGFTVDTSAPVAPPSPEPGVPGQSEWLDLLDDVGTITGTIGHGAITDDARPTFQGKLPEVGDVVAVLIYDKGQLIGRAEVNAQGAWSFTPDSDLADGEHDFQAASVDAAGNESAKTQSWPFSVLTTPPASLPQEVETLQLIDDVGAKIGLIARGDVTDDSKPQFMGSGASDEVVQVNIYDNGVLIGSAPVKDGSWSFEPDQPLLAGSHNFQAAPVDIAGNEGAKTSGWGFSLKLNAPQAPSLGHVIDDYGPITSAHLQPGAVIDDRTPTVSGTAEAGTTVYLYANGVESGSATVDEDGNWSVTLADLGGDGEKVITAKAVDEAGQSSPETGGFPIVLDTTAPARPSAPAIDDNVGSLTGPVTTGVTDDTTPTFSGTSEPGAIVTLKDDGKVLGSVLVDAQGHWNFTPSTPLAEGAHSITLEVRDAAGNLSEPSEAVALEINTQPVSVSVIQVLGENQQVIRGLVNAPVTNCVTPTLVGTATPGAWVTVMEGGKVLGSVVSDASGDWKLELPKQADGAHSYSVVASNGANQASTRFDLNVDTVAPEKPDNFTAIDDQGAITGPILNGVTDDATPTFQGKAEPGALITLRDGDQILGTTTAAEDGSWSFVPASLKDGEHAISVTATDRAGNVSEPSDVLLIKVDTSEVRVSITHVLDNVGSITGDIAKGGVTDDATPTLQGKGVAGETVRISHKGGTEIGTTKVDADGNWTFELPPQADGAHTYVATIDTGANTASAEFGLVIDTQAPSTPSTVVALDSQGQVTGPIVAGSTTDDASPVLSGQAEAGASITVYDGKQVLGSTVANEQGNWSFTPSKPLAEGLHSISIVATDKAGNSSKPSSPLDFSVSTASVSVSVTKAIDKVGSKTGDLSDKAVTDDTRPTLVGKATAGATVIVSDASGALGSVVADASGNWSLELPQQADGTHRYSVNAKGMNGNEASTGFELTIDTLAPSVPGVVTLTDNVGSLQGSLQPGQLIDDNAPVISGSGAVPGDVITLHDNGNKLGTAIVDGKGNWQYKPETPLADGEHHISASATDAAGNESAQGPSFSFSIDTVPPGVSTELDLYDDVGLKTGTIEPGSTTDDARPQFSGRLAAGDATHVNVYDGTKLLGTASVDADGRWSFQSPLLEAGRHGFRAEAVDAAGNVGKKTDSWEFVLVGNSEQPSQPSFSTVLDDQGRITGALQKGDSTDDRNLTVQGTADAGTVVKLYVDDLEVGSARVGQDGKWSIETGDLGADGVKHITAKSINDVGQESSVAGPYDIVLDTTAPSRPEPVIATDDVGEITGPIGAGSTTDDNLPTFSGSSVELGATVTILDGDKQLGTAIVDKDGNWVFTPSAPLAQGNHSISVTVTDKAGNTSQASEPLAFKVDTSDVVVNILRARDNVGSLQGDVSANGITDDRTPTLVGTATAGAVVTLMEGSVVLGSVSADATGNWSFELPEQVEGKHLYTAVAKNLAGAEGRASFALTIDTIAPEAPVISKVLDDVGLHTGELTNGGFTDDQSPTLYGTSEAEGDLIRIYDNGQLIGSVVAGVNGAWNWNPTGETEKLAEGTHQLTVTATDKAGNESAHSNAFLANVDVTAPTAVTQLDLVDDEGSVTGTIPHQGRYPTDDATPTFSGHVNLADGAVYVNVYNHGALLGTATVDAEGGWRFTPSPLENGDYAFSAAAVDAAGNEGPRSDDWNFTVRVGGPVEPVIIQVLDDFGPIQNALQPGAATDDKTLVLSGTGEPDALVFVYVRTTEEGAGTLVGSATADADGKWSLTTSDLHEHGGDGMKYLYAKSQDGTGQWSTETANFPVDLLTALPEAPSLLTFATQSFSSQATGNLIVDTLPVINGQTLPGGRVTLYDNGKVISEFTADADGNWSYTPQAALEEGAHVFTATLTDRVGNVSAASNPWHFVVDTMAPNIGLDINTAEQLSGLTEPGATVTLVDKAGASHTVVADQNGRWSIQPNPLGLGEDGRLSVADVLGNASKPIVIQGDVLASFDMTHYTALVNTTQEGDQTNPSVTTLRDGNIVVVWQSGNVAEGGADVHMQVFAADGVTKIGTEQMINQRHINNQDSAKVVALADGSYLVVWESYKAGPDLDADGVMARRYGADGTPLTDEFLVNEKTVGGQTNPVVVAHADGGYTVTWVSKPDSSTTYLIVQRVFDAGNKPVTGDVVVGSGDRYGEWGEPATSRFTEASHKGMYVTVWTGYNGPADKSSTGVIGQVFTADGKPLGGNFQVNTTTSNSQDQPDVVTLRDGSFVVVWQGNPLDKGNYDIYMARYSVNPETGALQQLGMGDERVNTAVAGQQYKPTLVALEDGGYLVIWGSEGGDGSGSAVFAQRYGAGGEKLGREFLVNPTTDGSQGWSGNSVDITHPVSASLMKDGKVYVTWQSNKADRSGWGIESAAIDIEAGYYSEFLVNTSTVGAQDSSSTIRLPGGGFLVVWDSATDKGKGPGDGIKAQLFDTKGMSVGGEISVSDTSVNLQGRPTVAVLKDGSFVFTWTSTVAGNSAIMQQRFGYTFDVDGQINGAAPQGGAYMVNVNDIGEQRYPNITALADGGYMVVWKSAVDGKWSLYARQYRADGSAVGGEQLVSETNTPESYNTITPAITTLDDGRVLFAYGRNSGGSAGYDTYFRIYNPANKTFGAEILANQTTAGNQASPSVTCLSNGHFVVTWDSNDNSGLDVSGYGVWGRVFNAAGEPISGEFLAAGSTIGNQVRPVVVAREGGGFVVLYQSASESAPGAGTYGVYAQYFNNAGQKVGQTLHINQLVAGDQIHISATFLDSGKLYVSWTDNGVGDGNGSAIKGRLVDLDSALDLIPPPPRGEGVTGLDYLPANPPKISTLSVGLEHNSADQLSGRTVPGAVVTVIDAKGVTHTATADEYGRWKMFPNPLAQGEQGTLSVHDAAGHKAEPVAIQGAALADFQLDRHTVLVNTTQEGNQTNPSVTTLRDGNIVVVWQSGNVAEGGADVHMQVFAADGVTKIGTEQLINQRHINNQDSAKVVALADGSYLVVWESYKAGPDLDADGVMARRYGADGTPLTDEFLVNEKTAGGQKSPVVVAHADGGYTVTWVSNPDSSTTSLIVQRVFDANNKPVTGDVIVGSGDRYGEWGEPATSRFTEASHKGMYVTVWTGYNGPADKSSTGVIGQIFTADGKPLGGNFQVNTTTGNSQDQPDVVTLKDGSFVVVWEGNPLDKGNYDIYMARYSVNPETGALQQIGMGDERVNTVVAGHQYKPTVVALEDGGYLVIWGSEGGDGSGSAVFAQRYGAGGEKLGREFLVNPTTEGNQGWSGESVDLKHPIAAALMKDGNVYVSWLSDKADSSGWGIQGTVIDIDAGYYSEFLVNSTTGGDQEKSASAGLPDGGFVVVWESATGDGSSYCVMAQMYDAKGMPVGSELRVNTTTTNYQGQPAVAVLNDGTFVVSWTSYAGGNDAIMQQRFGYSYDLQGRVTGAVAKGGEYMVNIEDKGNQRFSSILATDDGGYIVAWTSNTSGANGKWQVFMRQYSESGNPVSGDLLVGDATYYTAAGPDPLSMTSLKDGTVVMAYNRDVGGKTGVEAYFRLYDPLTKTMGTEVQANQQSVGKQSSPSVSKLFNGGFVVTWQSDDNSGPDQYGTSVWGRVFNAKGEALSGEFLVPGSTIGDQAKPIVVAREGGGFVVVYTSQGESAPGKGTFGVYAQYFDDAGHKVGSELHVNQLVTGDQTQVSATFLSSGKLFISWTDSGVSDGSGSAVKGRLVDLDATLGLTPHVPEGGATHVAYHPVSDIVGTAGHDTLDARGYTNALGGDGDDTIIIDGTGFGHIDGGAGHDTLVWASNNPLNLAAISHKVENIESIHLLDNVSQVLSLSLSDLLKVTGKDENQEQTLRVTGATGQNGIVDTVDINLTEWTKAEQKVTEGSVVYDVYNSTSTDYAHLLIQEGLQVV
ncbi:Ig-like domain-containing protein [Pseudomonas otitidis]|uniref:Ig-like domain-containing protein n=1 Tax=Metapseudomonas otitidis TaxID=319939 RepID=UPI0024AD8813|nr:Ig-like domain-containing protein [Pseudomonas otitidis]MDI6529051.1 Ig-like domain-containing protein [Pseudomonas otitidis]